jgi:tetratricopeptide (TPR) repeat protein
MDEFTTKRAEKLLRTGLEAACSGKINLALEKFRESANVRPTADALTYWGWMEYHGGRINEAIELCREAIVLDPEFGNPYNDIGSYLISKGEFDDAIPWLEKATTAKRYQPKQFPHINLGRVYLAKNQLNKAVEHFRKALEYVPGDPQIVRAIETILGSLKK